MSHKIFYKSMVWPLFYFFNHNNLWQWFNVIYEKAMIVFDITIVAITIVDITIITLTLIVDITTIVCLSLIINCWHNWCSWIDNRIWLQRTVSNNRVMKHCRSYFFIDSSIVFTAVYRANYSQCLVQVDIFLKLQTSSAHMRLTTVKMINTVRPRLTLNNMH